MNKRLKNLRRALAREKLDALLVRTHEGDNENVLYLSGFGGTTGYLLITATKAFIIVDARYYTRAAREAPGFKMIKVTRGAKIAESINEALAQAGLRKSGRLGFEAARVPVQIASLWERSLKARLVPTNHLVERFRQFKDADEIRQLGRACRITCRVFSEVAPLIKPGMPEAEVAFEIDIRLRRYGAVDNSFTTIAASGPNSACPHHATGNRKLKAGEPLVLDFGGLFPGGYCSDITRTVFVPGKKPDPQLVEVYKIVLGANRAARKALRPGLTWADYDRVARDYISQRGYGQYFTHGLGHSLGLVAHDPYDYENDPFEPGAVMTDEPGIYIDGLGGVRIEDDLVVTTNGARNLTGAAPYLKF